MMDGAGPLGLIFVRQRGVKVTTPASPPPSYGHVPVPVPPPPKRRFPKWLIVLGVVLLLAVLWKCGSVFYAGRKLANAFVQDFHQKLNSGQYEEICNAADDGFTRSGKHEDLIKFFASVHTKLGNAGDHTLTNLRIDSNTNGTFLIAHYSTTFERGAAEETFTWVSSGNTLRLYGYNIQSNALLTN